MNHKLMNYIENSFLRPLIEQKTVTDISFNGKSMFYMDNKLGRKKYDKNISVEEASDFVRQVANLAERQFSYTSPTLDISISRYRINAQHSSIVRVGDEKSVSFAIRLASNDVNLDGDQNFLDEKAKKILLKAIKEKQSIVIAGPTGSGKTELQKYLISKFDDCTRVIIIDNVQELDYLHFNPELDITSWQISPAIPQGNAQELIRNALRNNPDWLVVAESRGKEMNDALNAVMTGHPIITTLHAKSLETIPHRIMRMIQMNNIEESASDILLDVYEHITYFVYVNREINANKEVVRYVEKIGKSDGVKKMKTIYQRGKENEES